MILLSAPLAALCGELTAALADTYPDLIMDVAPASLFKPDCPDSDDLTEGVVWEGVPFEQPVKIHDFTFLADYGDPLEAAAIYGRLYGPKARAYILDRRRSTVAWRLRIQYGQVKK
jgi:hypothetical protein